MGGFNYHDAKRNQNLLLWDTVTNQITDGPGVPGLEDYRLFRPTIGKLGENSVLLVGARLTPSQEPLKEIWRYDFNDAGGTWKKLSDSPDPLANVEQNGIYVLSNPDLGTFDTLLRCEE